MSYNYSEYNKKYYQEHKEKIKEHAKEYRGEHKENIKKYRQEHREETKQYYREHKEQRQKYAKEYREANNKRLSEYKKEWHQRNRKRRLKKSAKYYKENKEKIKKVNKEYYLENRKKILKRNNNYIRNLYRTNPKYRLRMSVSHSMRYSLKNRKNGAHWEDKVDFTLEELMTHLESKFLKGMTWANYGEWHIDHKIPIAVFNFDNPNQLDFSRCWALENLRPMWAMENIRKGNKINKPFQPSLKL